MTSLRTLVTSHAGLAEELPLIHTSKGDTPAAYYSVVRQKVKERFEEATRI
jgi:hypothetical protein